MQAEGEIKKGDNTARAVISFVNGLFWCKDAIAKTAIPVEHCSSHAALQEWAEDRYDSVLYNFPEHLLPREDIVCSTEVVKPSRVLSPAKPRISNRRAPSMRKLAAEHPKTALPQIAAKARGAKVAILPTHTCLQCQTVFARKVYGEAGRSKTPRKFCKKDCQYQYFREHPAGGAKAKQSRACLHCGGAVFNTALNRTRKPFCNSTCSFDHHKAKKASTMKIYIVYVDGNETGTIKAGSQKAAEKKAQSKYPGKQIQVAYTEL